jgi:hypothetical protein
MAQGIEKQWISSSGTARAIEILLVEMQASSPNLYAQKEYRT